VRYWCCPSRSARVIASDSVTCHDQTMRQLLPDPIDSVDVDQIAALYAYAPHGGVRANMVSTLDGAVSADGRSEAISGPPDRFMFGLLRALSDVIVVGAGTARTEGYGPGRARPEFAQLRVAAGQPATPTIAVFTRSGQLDPASTLFTEAKQRTLVITCDAAPPDRRSALSKVADVIVSGDEEIDLVLAVSKLRERGHKNVLTEGGPRLLGDITAAGLLDELALSLSPLLAGGTAGRIMKSASVVLQQMQIRVLLEDSGFLFGLFAAKQSGQETVA
jgi:riboflavin biosynthesis pyrimidine reductase